VWSEHCCETFSKDKRLKKSGEFSREKRVVHAICGLPDEIPNPKNEKMKKQQKNKLRAHFVN